MKYVLTILSLLITSITFAQQRYVVKVQGTPGVYDISKSGDSLVYYVAGVRYAVSVGSTVDLSNYYNKSQTDALIPTNVSQLANDAGYINSAAIAGKTNNSDTAAMLNPYLSKVLAAATYAIIGSSYTKAEANSLLAGKANTSDINWTKSASNIYYNNGTVAINTTDNAFSALTIKRNGNYDVLNLNKTSGSYGLKMTLDGYTWTSYWRTYEDTNNGNMVFGSPISSSVTNEVLRLHSSGQMFVGLTTHTIDNVSNGMYIKSVNDDTLRFGLRASSVNNDIIKMSSNGMGVSGNVRATSLIKSGGTSSQLLAADGSVKSMGIASGNVMDAGRIIDSLAAANARIGAKMDSSYRDTTGLKYPLQFDSTNNQIRLAQSYLDSLAAKVNPVFTGTAKINSDTLATKADVRAGFPDLSSRNFADDSVAITGGGLKQYEWYRNIGDVKVVTHNPWDYYTGMFYIVSDSMSAHIKFLNYSPTNFAFTAYWDNTNQSDIEKYSGNYSYDLNKNFGVKENRISAFSVQDIANVREINIDSISDFVGFSKFTNLYKLAINNSFIGGLSGFSGTFPSTLKVLHFYNNSDAFSSFDFDGVPAGLEELEVQDSGPISTFYNLSAIPTGITIFNIKYCGLSVTNINDILVALDGLTFTGGAVSIDLRQGTGAAPTGAGATAKANLISEGNTVLTD